MTSSVHKSPGCRDQYLGYVSVMRPTKVGSLGFNVIANTIAASVAPTIFIPEVTRTKILGRNGYCLLQVIVIFGDLIRLKGANIDPPLL